MTLRRKNQRGNAMVEFALASAVLIPLMMGAFQFGYTFYTYNELQSAVANGARYASFRTYRCLSGATDIAKVKTAIQNMTVYSSPTVSSGVPVVKGLTPSAINVTFNLNSTQIPIAVTVSVKTFTVDSLFQKYTFAGKPASTLPYLGRYASQESEP